MKRCRAYHFVNGYDCREGGVEEEQIELEDRRGGEFDTIVLDRATAGE